MATKINGKCYVRATLLFEELHGRLNERKVAKLLAIHGAYTKLFILIEA